MKIKSLECLKSIRNCKEKILGTSDAWSASHLSHLSSKAAYYNYCRLSDFYRTQIQNWALFLPLSHEMTKILEKNVPHFEKVKTVKKNYHPVLNSFSTCVTCRIILIPKMKTCSNYYANATLQGLLTLCVWNQIFPAK